MKKTLMKKEKKEFEKFKNRLGKVLSNKKQKY